MKRLSIFCYCKIGCLFFFSCCVNRISDKTETIQAIKIYNHGPSVFAKDINDFSIDSITAIKIDKYIIYFFGPIISRRNQVLIFDSIRASQVFIYNEKETHGYIYDSLNSNQVRKMLVDSFISMYTTTNKNPISENDSMVSQVMVTNKISIEKYVPKIKQVNSYDTLFVFYNEALKNSWFSLSTATDKIKKKKLSKFGYYMKATESIKERHLYWEMKEETELHNVQELQSFIKKHNSLVIE